MCSKVRKVKHLQATWQFLGQGPSKERNEYTWAIKTFRYFFGTSVRFVFVGFFLYKCFLALKTLINLYLLSRVLCLWNRNFLSLLLIKRHKVLACSAVFFQLSLCCTTFFQLRTFILLVSSKTSSSQSVLGQSLDCVTHFVCERPEFKRLSRTQILWRRFSLPSSGSPNIFCSIIWSEYKIALFAKFSSSLLPDCHAIWRWLSSDIGSHLVYS
jgi:hypothetical protein